MGSYSSIDDRSEFADHYQSTGIASQPAGSHGAHQRLQPPQLGCFFRQQLSSHPSRITTGMRSWIGSGRALGGVSEDAAGLEFAAIGSDPVVPEAAQPEGGAVLTVDPVRLFLPIGAMALSPSGVGRRP